MGASFEIMYSNSLCTLSSTFAPIDYKFEVEKYTFKGHFLKKDQRFCI